MDSRKPLTAAGDELREKLRYTGPLRVSRDLAERLLSTLAQAQHEAYILSRVIDVMGYEGHLDAIPERLSALLTPPPDAAVREEKEGAGEVGHDSHN